MARRASFSRASNPSPLHNAERIHRHSMDDSLVIDGYDDIFSSVGLESADSQSNLNRTHPDGADGGARRDVGRESFNDWKQKNAEKHVPQLNNTKKKQMLKQQQRKSISQSHYGNGSSYAGSVSNYSMASSKSESEVDFDDDGTMITNLTTDSGLRHSIQAATSKLNYFQSTTNSGLLSAPVNEEEEEREDELFFHSVDDENEDDASIDIPLGDDEAPAERNKKAVLEKYMNAPRRPLSRQSPQNSYSSANSETQSENGKYQTKTQFAAVEQVGISMSPNSNTLDEGHSKDSLESYLPKSSVRGSISSQAKTYEHIAHNDERSVNENQSRQGRRRRSSVSIRSKQRGSFALERLRTFVKTEIERPNFRRNCCLSFTMLLFVCAAIAMGVYFGTNRNADTSGEIESVPPQDLSGVIPSNSTDKGDDKGGTPFLPPRGNATEDVDTVMFNGTSPDNEDFDIFLNISNHTDILSNITNSSVMLDEIVASDEISVMIKTPINANEVATSLSKDGVPVSATSRKRVRGHLLGQ